MLPQNSPWCSVLAFFDRIGDAKATSLRLEINCSVILKNWMSPPLVDTTPGLHPELSFWPPQKGERGGVRSQGEAGGLPTFEPPRRGGGSPTKS